MINKACHFIARVCLCKVSQKLYVTYKLEFTHEVVEAQVLDVPELRVLGVAEELSHDVEIGVGVPRLVYQVLRHVQLRVMRIVKSKPIEDRGHVLNVGGHVAPELWGVLGLGAVAELGAVAPGDGRTSQMLPAFFAPEFVLTRFTRGMKLQRDSTEVHSQCLNL